MYTNSTLRNANLSTHSARSITLVCVFHLVGTLGLAEAFVTMAFLLASAAADCTTCHMRATTSSWNDTAMGARQTTCKSTAQMSFTPTRIYGGTNGGESIVYNYIAVFWFRGVSKWSARRQESNCWILPSMLMHIGITLAPDTQVM